MEESMKKFKLGFALILVLAVAMLLGSCTMMMPTTQTQTCVAHRDLNKDLLCDVCGAAMPVNCTSHNDLDHDGKCDTNGCTVTLAVYHIDLEHTGTCEVCGKTVTVNHEDFDEEDGLCDICGKPVDGSCLECVDEDEDGECDVCGSEVEAPVEPCDKCVDEDDDKTCDVCGSAIVICEHADKNFDGKCDKCKNDIEGAVQILNKGTTQFKFVLASGAISDHRMLLDNLIQDLSELGVTFEEGYDVEVEEVEYEVLLGVVKNRDDQYKLDPHVYGMKGYTVQLVDNKIVILGGSDKSLSDGIEAFKSSFLGITESTKSLKNMVRYVSPVQNVVEIQDDYTVKTITLLGEDIRDYKIVASVNSSYEYNTALAIQNTLYQKSGYWLDIVEPGTQSEKVIVISYAAKTGGDGYRATFSDGKMEFVCEYSTVIQSEISAFFTKKFALASGTLDIVAKDNYVKNVRDVFYKDYGANGEDENDDAEAIRAAHEYANQGGHTVVADWGATYYIGRLEKTITVKTNVDWRDAKFMLQDYLIAPTESIRGTAIFTVEGGSAPSLPALTNRLKEINAGGVTKASEFKSFEFEFGQPLLLRVYDDNHKNYIRYGVNENSGATQQEVILVDEHGNLDPTTPLMFDFNQITKIWVYPLNDEPITLQGGLFYTSPWLQDTETSYTAYGRGISVRRCNVTVQNVKHYLINEGDYNQSDHQYRGESVDYGCPYGGFYTTKLCANVRFYNCLASSHITYWQTKGAGMGTYDIDPSDSINILFEECYQEDDNYFNASGQSRWGVMGSSGNKNVTFLNSKLTRFDAHNGIHNASIINSEIKMIRVDGTGTFLMENSIQHSNTFFGLREDYGGFWHGNIILKNNVIVTGNSNINIFTNTWYNHYFGYPTAYATNIVIDGLTIYKDEVGGTLFTGSANLFGSGILSGATNIMQDYLPVKDAEGLEMYYSDGTPVLVPNKNQTPPPERVVIRNVTTFTMVIPSAAQYPWFENTVFEVNKNTECVEHFDWTGDLKCDDCGADFTPCEEHTDYNNDGYCTWCGTVVAISCDKHIDKELNGKCDICHVDYVCDAHIDADKDRICDKCGGVLGCKEPHVDAGNDGICDVCKKTVPTCTVCVDVAPHDSKCDKCKADMVATVDPCESCTDSDENGKCDECGGNVVSEAE